MRETSLSFGFADDCYQFARQFTRAGKSFGRFIARRLVSLQSATQRSAYSRALTLASLSRFRSIATTSRSLRPSRTSSGPAAPMGSCPAWPPASAPCETCVRRQTSAQPVDATQALNLSAGVSNVRLSSTVLMRAASTPSYLSLERSDAAVSRPREW